MKTKRITSTLILLLLFPLFSLQASISINFQTDVGNLDDGFGTGWFSGGDFDTTVAGGWDAGDYDWQLGQQLGADNTTRTTDFAPGSIDFATFQNNAGTWSSTDNTIVFNRGSNPSDVKLSNDDLVIHALTMDVLAAPELVNVTTDIGAKSGASIGYQIYLNSTAVDGRSLYGSSGTQVVSSTFTLSQGDSVYFVVDSDGNNGNDQRSYDFTIATIPEPSSLLLVGTALLSIYLVKRRRG